MFYSLIVKLLSPEGSKKEIHRQTPDKAVGAKAKGKGAQAAASGKPWPKSSKNGTAPAAQQSGAAQGDDQQQ